MIVRPHLLFKNRITLYLLLLGLALPVLSIGQMTDVAMDLGDRGTLLYITDVGGKDAIVVQSTLNRQVLYECQSETELILTPRINKWGQGLSFLVDQGPAGRTIHTMHLHEDEKGIWSANDSIVATLPGASWPVLAKDGSIYLVLPDVNDLDASRVTGLFKLSMGSIQPVSSAQKQYKHYWPLISWSGKQIMFRQLFVAKDVDSPDFWTRMVILDIESDSQQIHFVNEYLNLEQWLTKGILMSAPLNDQRHTRVYSLYDPISRQLQEIHRTASWQARLTEDLNTLATIRPDAPGATMFDIFIIDLTTGEDTNLTQTPGVSESLIGWLN